jgi:hypothetical protein
MSDVAQQSREPNLFDVLPKPAPSARAEGLAAAGKTQRERYRQIRQLLTDRGPLAGWQIAQALGCQLHQISGRLTEMREQKLIEKTGERRKNPRTNTSGEVVRLMSIERIEEL